MYNRKRIKQIVKKQSDLIHETQERLPVLLARLRDISEQENISMQNTIEDLQTILENFEKHCNYIEREAKKDKKELNSETAKDDK